MKTDIRRSRDLVLPAMLGLLFANAAFANSPPVDTSTIRGKVMVGYQGWFRCPGDGSPANNWLHWSDSEPRTDHFYPPSYPDVTDFGDGPARCVNPYMTVQGGPAYLFSSYPQQTADVHFRWMREYNIDGALMQRFIGETAGYREEDEAIFRHAMKAAEENGRSFAIEYDLSHGDITVNGQQIPYYSQSDDVILSDITSDWLHLVNDVHLTDSPAYQREAGKPLVSIWGLGMVGAGGKPQRPELVHKLIQWFKTVAHAEVMGGTGEEWRDITEPGWKEVLSELDVIQPWTVGVIDSKPAPNGVEGWRTRNLLPDIAQTNANGQLLMPVMIPGSAGRLDHVALDTGTERNGGELLWQEVKAVHEAGAVFVKVAMFDEINEGTQLIKTSPSAKTSPDQMNWVNLDADGYKLPSDWYLRLMYEAGRVFHGEVEPSETVPTDPGPLDPAPSCGVLHANESVTPARPLTSCSGLVSLKVADDGEVAVWRGTTSLYAAGTKGIVPGAVGMQGDGNFVVYDVKGVPRWATGTAGHPGAYFNVRNDGTAQVVSGSTVLWQYRP
ncbi:hypothetical protein SAMN02800694_2790 [Luteibacter sp. UNCMF331Sha3.1]|uniref:hypothetical protein n=1 Tax=Luteibacter sp. UNCMF331Sha3.1 TaxID=1502760 RepID=UPI0008B6EC6A|nr:hypothetical protein [Luteibacter sp. UNCMF331Sha3.1]SEN10632.1 hypothetical protein SAMN02800694_2790 [Luteibacter sp. UNCMF331Sha3.1]